MAKRAPAKPNRPDPLIEMGQEEEDEDFYTFIDEIGPSIATVDVFRLQPNGSRPHVDRVTIDAIRDDVYAYLRTLGAGKYLLQFKNADRTIKRTKTLEVAGVAGAVVATNGQPAGSMDHMQFMREQMATQQTLIMGLIGALSNGNKGPDLSFLSGVLKAPDLTGVFTLMAAMINKKDDGGGLAMAKQIVELSRDLSPDAKEPDSWLSVAKEVGGKVVEVFGAGATIRPPVAALPPGPTPPPPAVRVTEVQPGGDTQVTVTAENFPHYLKEALKILKEKARKNRDPGGQADVITANDDEPQWIAILGAIEQGATMDTLLQFDPEIAENPAMRNWFSALYDELRAEIFDTMDPSRKTGDRTNPGSDAPPGPGRSDAPPANTAG